MQTKTIKSTQEIINFLESDFKDNLQLKDKHFYFIDTLIRHRADRKSIYLSSKLLKKTFGDRTYKSIINYFVENGIVERYQNLQDGGYSYYKYKLLVSIKKLVEYQLTYKPLIKIIDYFIQTNYNSLLDFEKQVLQNIEQLQIPSNFDIPKLYITKSKNTGRLFHTLTNMSKKLRYKLKHIKNIRLVEIDAKNAQLIMLSYWYNDDDVFNDAVYSGEFYKILADEMGIDISDDAKKDEFKRKFFNSILFNSNRKVITNSKYGIAFKKLFPITFQHIIEIDTNKSKARELQSSESNLFINNITKDIVKSGMFVIPIHDAFIINIDDIEKVQNIINENCYYILGRLITMSVKEFCPTIDDNTTYINIYNKGEAERESNNNNHKGVYMVQSDSMVGQNKKTAIMNEKINVITTAIKQLMADNQKITIRKIQGVSGVAKATVEKHYKRILTQITEQKELDDEKAQIENNDSEIEFNCINMQLKLKGKLYKDRIRNRINNRLNVDK